MEQAEEQKYTIDFKQLPLQGFEHNKAFLAEDIVRQAILNMVFTADDKSPQKLSSALLEKTGHNSSVSAAPCENVEKFPGERAALLEYMAHICRGSIEKAPILRDGKPFDFDHPDEVNLSLSISKMAITNRIEIEVGKWDRYVLDFVAVKRFESGTNFRLYDLFLIAIRDSPQEDIPGKLIHFYTAPEVIGYKVFHYRGVMYATILGNIYPFIYDGEQFVMGEPTTLNFLTVDRLSSPETLLAYEGGKILRIGAIDCVFSGKKKEGKSYELLVEADLNIPLERLWDCFVDLNAKIWIFVKPFMITVLDSDLKMLVSNFDVTGTLLVPDLYKDQKDRILVAFSDIKCELSLIPR